MRYACSLASVIIATSIALLIAAGLMGCCCPPEKEPDMPVDMRGDMCDSADMLPDMPNSCVRCGPGPWPTRCLPQDCYLGCCLVLLPGNGFSGCSSGVCD